MSFANVQSKQSSRVLLSTLQGSGIFVDMVPYDVIKIATLSDKDEGKHDDSKIIIIIVVVIIIVIQIQ